MPQVALDQRDVLRFNPDLLQSADGDEGLPGADFHTLHEGGHGDKAGDPEDDPQHGEERTELVGPDLLKADADGIAEIHGRTGV